MKKTKENGVTLITLVITIIVLLILVSVGTNVGKSTMEYAAFTEFKDELVILQTKVNELSQNNDIEMGQELTEEQKSIFNITAISDIIFKNKTQEEKINIKNGFRYFNSEHIKNELGFDGILEEYIINIEYGYVIHSVGYEYEDNIYYMIDQIDDEIYNVRYKDKNPKEGSFEVTFSKENNKWKVEITNIQYSGYISNWNVKYKADGDAYWSTANGLSFYVPRIGNYYVQVSHGDDINLGSKLVSITE